MDTVTLERRLSQPAKEFLHQPSRLLIDGKLVEAASGKTFPVYNPATGAILMQVAEADSADVDRAVKAARRGDHGHAVAAAHRGQGMESCDQRRTLQLTARYNESPCTLGVAEKDRQ